MAERWRGLRIALACAAVALAVVAVHPAETDASWTSRQRAGGTVAAATIQPPVIAVGGCSYTPGLLGANSKVVVSWSFPPFSPAFAMPDNAGFASTAGSVVGSLLSGLLGSTPPSTTPASGAAPAYTTTFTLPPLSGTLGATFTVGVLTQKNGWTSNYATAVATSTLAGLFPSCTVQPAA